MSAPATGKKVLHIGKYFPPHVGAWKPIFKSHACLGNWTSRPCAGAQSKTSLTSVEESFSANGSALRVVRAATWCRLLFTPISPVSRCCCQLIKRIILTCCIYTCQTSAFWALVLPSARRLPWVIHGSPMY